MKGLEDYIDDFLSDVSYLGRIADDTDYDNFERDFDTFRDTLDDLQDELDTIKVMIRKSKK